MPERVQELLDAVEHGQMTLDQAADHLDLMGIDPADYGGEFQLAAWYAEQGV